MIKRILTTPGIIPVFAKRVLCAHLASIPLDDGEYFTPDRSSAFVKMDTHPSETDGRGKGKYGMDAASTRALRVCGCLRLHALRPPIVHGEESRGRESGKVGLRKIIPLME